MEKMFKSNPKHPVISMMPLGHGFFCSWLAFHLLARILVWVSRLMDCDRSPSLCTFPASWNFTVLYTFIILEDSA